MPETAVSDARYGSDLIVDLMRAYGIEYAAFNPGATFRGIHDSLVNYHPERGPAVIECAHEEISVAIAHGYAKAAGKPMVALVHNIVGLQHASMAIYNAWVDRVPVLVLGGTGPRAISRRRPWIDWIHTALVQGNLVRDFVKYDDEPFDLDGVVDSFARGYRLATQEPQGPIYLNYDVDLQESRLPEGFQLPPVDRFVPPTPLVADMRALEAAAEMLVAADYPLVIADYSGRNPEAVPALTALVDLLALPVWDKEHRMSFPSTHPLDITGDEDLFLARADCILALDVEDLFGSLNRYHRAQQAIASRIRPDCRVIHLSLRALSTRSWAHDFQRLTPTALEITGDSALALPVLTELCHQRLRTNPGRRQAVERRRQRVERYHQAIRERARAFAQEAGGKTRGFVHPATLAMVLDDLLKSGDWMIANGNLGGWARRLMRWEKPRNYLGSAGGGGLGYGLGATLGACLATRREPTLVVDLQADGDFLFTPSALWTAAHYGLNPLVVMDNNRTYYNSQHHAWEVAKQRGRPVENQRVGTAIDGPPVDFAALARAYGCAGIGPVTDPDGLEAALKAGLAEVERGRLCVVDVVTCPTHADAAGQYE